MRSGALFVQGNLRLLAGPVLLGAMQVSAVGGVLTFFGVTMISPTLWPV